MSNEIHEAQLYWDSQDPANEGWWLRYHDDHGTEQGYAIDGEADATVEELGTVVIRRTDASGRIIVYCGDVRRGWIDVSDGQLIGWRVA